MRPPPDRARRLGSATPAWVAAVWSVAAAAGLVVAAMHAQAAGAPPEPIQGHEGASLYRTYCASCHGVTGRGDGAMGPYLRRPPANLVHLARANRGVFPADQVAQIIDGRRIVRSHGTSDMPVWGLVFGRSTMLSSATEVDARTRALVEYLASIQERPSD